jgi:ribonuclease H2 subunit A
LNQMSHDAAMELVRRILDDGLDVASLYVDAVGDDAKYRRKLQQAFPEIETIVVESKADANYPIVSVASIVAKVTRDESIEALKKDNPGIGDFGSGYPGDAKAKRWLEKNFDPLNGYPDFVRLSWNTIRDVYVRNGAAPPL